jgi:hypothetical protein
MPRYPRGIRRNAARYCTPHKAQAQGQMGRSRRWPSVGSLGAAQAPAVLYSRSSLPVSVAGSLAGLASAGEWIDITTEDMAAAFSLLVVLVAAHVGAAPALGFTRHDFPDDFVFGAATSAYQVTCRFSVSGRPLN